MTQILSADAAGIARAAQLLRAGALVAFGTETVYGLGADATNGRAVANVFAAKGRPHFNPLICHYPDAAAAFAQVVPNAWAERLAATFWPGPLSLVLPRRPSCPGLGPRSQDALHPPGPRPLERPRGPVFGLQRHHRPGKP